MTASAKANLTVIINNNGMGQAEPALSHKLIKTWLNLLDLDDRLPQTVCFYAEGVKLACTGSPVLEELQSLAAKGVAVIVCTTCLNHYGLLDELQAGHAGGMKDIVEAQWTATKVITC
ncbi:MAG: DsrE family protein [Candidatus Krumholzibacteria bacterium]|nr:DsrE family protein [Candidatus Krumholzibacteria bacterium]